ncbi:MAG TPA: type II secretion system F family protein [Marmoricola sp.]|nr:type II secretion system F family protein [Marmoricola sp.]
MSTRPLRLLAVSAVVALGALLPGAANAAGTGDGTTIDHAQQHGGTLQLLVSVPGDDPVDLSSVHVTIDGTPVTATATQAASSDVVRRTAVLAIDTSLSMKGSKITEARKAALSYLDSVPANVDVGIVTFDDSVVVRQQPSLDRAASKAILGHLPLHLNTALYAGVRSAIKATGKDGQRQVLVLSDGQDNTGSALKPVTDAITASGVRVDVVSLEQGATAPAPLAAMAQAGSGEVIPATDPTALSAAFSKEAGTLARQVLVTAKIPADEAAASATVRVGLDAGGSTHTAQAFVAVKDSSSPTPAIDTVSNITKGSVPISEPLMYAAVFAIGLGAIGLIFALAGAAKADARVPLAAQFDAYTATQPISTPESVAKARLAQQGSSSLADQAKQAAANVLSSNAEVESRIALRLEGAGMSLKSSEWLLLHIGIAFGAGLLGLLISGANPIFGILMGALGALGPWLYLGYKRSKRLSAFGAGLADTLQLMSGSLSAGLSLAQSLDTIVREGTEPITAEFKRVIVEARLGVPIEDALDGVADRMGSRDFKWVVMAIRIQREVGGNLAELLLTVAATLREREYLRRHVKALSAEGRLSCWILGGLPPGFLVYLTLTKPDYVHPMYSTGIGTIMCIAMVVLLSVGVFWMSKVSKVDV